MGIASALPRALSVPGGGSVPSAGTTWVGVLPTHRRRGVLRALMTRHLADSSDAGDAVSILWASEPSIYGRFGYGVATRALALQVPHGVDLDRAPQDRGLRARLLDADEALPHLRAVHDAAARRRPGAPARDDRGGAGSCTTPRRAGTAGASGATSWCPARRVPAATPCTRRCSSGAPSAAPAARCGSASWSRSIPAARAALWSVLTGHDLMSRVVWRNAPSDEPLLEWAEVRGLVTTVTDQMYVRVLDVGAALTARAYAAPLDVVLEVRDDMRSDVAGRWRLVVGADGRAEVGRTRSEPALRVDVRELGAVYLGARSLLGLARAGLVDVEDGAAVAAVSRAFRYEPDAWCPSVF